MGAGVTEGLHLTGGFLEMATRASWGDDKHRRCITRLFTFRRMLHVGEVVVVLVPLS
jgi:hypothetical protein